MGNDRQTAATFLELAPEEIEAQLDRVLASRLFTSAKSCSSFLRFVVKQTLAGQGYRIKESNVGVEVFGRAPGYDPGGDPVVRVRAGRLRARLRDYYASDGRLDPILIDLPKGGYVPVFHRREAQSAKARIAPVRWLLPVVVCVAGLLVTLVATRPAESRSIAVLPFLNLTGGPTDDMLADGLAEELATVLAQNRNLRVVARSSAFEFRGNRDVRSIGRQLDTRFVLEGSFRREGDRLIVLVHLIETAHGYQLLADRFERPSSHAYAIPAEIARRTILALGLQ